MHERALALSKRVGTFRLMKGRRFTPWGYDGAWGKTARPVRAEHDASDNGAGAPAPTAALDD